MGWVDYPMAAHAGMWRPPTQFRRLFAVAVYEYQAIYRDHPERLAEGTLIARNKLHALDLLTQRGLTSPRLKAITGLSAFFKQMTADIR